MGEGSGNSGGDGPAQSGFPQDMDDSWRYNLIADNCQDYVADVLKRAEAIARKKGVPLIVE